MSRRVLENIIGYTGFPRSRGDEPIEDLEFYGYMKFSPLTRG